MTVMPLRVFLCHASSDKPFVERVKQQLEEGGDIQCWLDKFEIGLGANIASRINDGLAKSEFLLLFISPASLKSRVVEEEWTTAYWAQVNSGDTRLIPVLLGECQLPSVLQNKKHCDLPSNELEGIRQLKAELILGRPSSQAGGGSAASLPNFVGREAELRELKERLTQPGSLVPIVGMPGVGKTYLAREFIRRYGSRFEPVCDLDCQKKDLAALTGELARQLGLRLEGEAGQVAAELRQYLSAKRCLLLLDNVEDDQPGELAPGGRAAVLVTTRHGAIPFLAAHPELKPPLFTKQEASDLFRRVLGTVPEPAWERLFDKLGFLPIAIAVSAGLIKHDVRFTVESLLASLPPAESFSHGRNNVGRLLKEAIEALNENERRLLAGMAACAPAGVRLGFAAEVAELRQPDSLDALQGLYSRSLVIEIDRVSRRYRLHPLIRDAASPPTEVTRRHAELVGQHLTDWERAPLESAEFIEEAGEALRTLAGTGEQVGIGIAIDAGNLSGALGRLGEAQDFYVWVQEAAARVGSPDWLQRGLSGQALILQVWGRLAEAMSLLNRQEVICQKLGDRANLGRNYGNQAVILQDWGRFDEAMALHNKQEAICLELGDRAGLQVCYGNQGLILKAWGRLEEAMSLLKKQEAICQKLGDRAGLRACYGNQALILKAWGRLEEAMGLHKKEEAICLELGDRAGLQSCYGNQALILKAWGQLNEAMALLKRKEAICLELGDRAGLQSCYGNQAIILKAWGRLDEAMALHKKQEAICQELGDRAGLAYCYWQLGLLLREQKDAAGSKAKLESALAIFTELKMPRQRDAVLRILGEIPG